ncbi:hypothetical protein FB480_103345 [Agrobacterium vitis]|nr:hypothetical protein FB480_103345 [Agrobacterium vitis]
MYNGLFMSFVSSVVVTGAHLMLEDNAIMPYFPVEHRSKP